MAEYICREAIIDDLEKEIEAGNAALDEDVWINKGLRIAIRDIKDIKTADVQPVKRGEWISCKDRMPKENTLVLCYAKSTAGEGNNYFLGAQAHGEFWFLKVNDIGHVSCPVLHWEVTHWMPLPEPPKE